MVNSVHRLEPIGGDVQPFGLACHDEANSSSVRSQFQASGRIGLTSSSQSFLVNPVCRIGIGIKFIPNLSEQQKNKWNESK